jgi:hypothetical protein
MDTLSQFRKIVADASAAFGSAAGAPEIIPFGAALVDLVRAFPAEREAFEREFIANTRVAPPELMEFCMHALRWESLRQYFSNCQRKAISENDWRIELYFRHILEAFENEWADAEDFYASYFRSCT